MLPWIRTTYKKRKTARIFSIAIVFLFLFFGLSIATDVFAQADLVPVEFTTNTFGTQEIDQTIKLASTDIRIIVMKIIRAALGLLGIIAVSLIVYAGFLIMTSGGDEEKIGRGRKTMINAVVGLIIILSAVSIVQFVINSLTGQIVDGGLSGDGFTGQTFSGSGSLGRVIKDHYPFRDEIDVVRNTSIVVTFSIPVEPSSFILNSNNSCWNADYTDSTLDCIDDGEGGVENPYYGDCIESDGENGTNFATECDLINTSSIKFDISESMSSTTIDQMTVGLMAAAMVTYEGNAQDVFTVVVKPLNYLGSSDEEFWYTVRLNEDIFKKGSLDSIFSEQWDDYYEWEFRTSINLDLNPPHVTNIYPKAGQIVSRNSIIQINFNEAIDPTTITGHLATNSFFNNILVNSLDTVISGTWRVSNGYRTVAFVSDEACGQNSCGEQMFCLPTGCAVGDSECTSTYNMLLRTAVDTGNAEVPFEAVPFTGVYDLAFNALNNVSNDNINTNHNKPSGSVDANGLATTIINENEELNPDNEYWGFAVQNKIDRRAPAIEIVTPGIDAEDIEGNEEVGFIFNNVMWYQTFDDIKINEYPEHVCADVALDGGSNDCKIKDKLSSFWSKVFTSSTDDGKTHTKMKHREFGPNDLDLYYFPEIPHTVKSVTQNCMYPGRGPKASDVSCVVKYNDDGSVLSHDGCVDVTYESDKDTGCIYNSEGGLGDNVLQTSTSTCIIQLEEVSPSDYK